MKMSRKSGLIVGNIMGIILMVSGIFNHDDASIFIGIGWIILWNLIGLIPSLQKNVNNIQKESENSSYINENRQLYRDIINTYSISELAYLDGFSISIPKDLVSVLLKLELNKKIRIEDDLIVVLEKQSVKKSEEYILEHIVDGKLVIKNINELERIIRDELYDDELIFFKKDYSAIFVVLFFILFLIGWFYDPILTFLFGMFGGIFMIIIFGDDENRLLKLKEKGKKLYLELSGLKDFLYHFDNMNEKEKDDLKLWEDYLIYSVIFGYNTKIVSEYKKLVIYDE